MAENRYDELIEDMEEQGREESGTVMKWAVRCGVGIVLLTTLIGAYFFINNMHSIPFIRDMSPLVSFFMIPLIALAFVIVLFAVYFGSVGVVWRLDNLRSKDEKIQMNITRMARMIIKIDREIDEIERSDKPEESRVMMLKQNRELREEALQALSSILKQEKPEMSPESVIEQELFMKEQYREEIALVEEQFRSRSRW